MKLSKKAREDFKKIYREQRGVILTDEETDQMGWKLLQLHSLVMQPKNGE